MTNFIVTEKAMRPASSKRECFYCHRQIGEYHKHDCVLVSKKVKIRAVFEYEIDVPSDWDKRQIEFHRNEGSWCADNAIDEIEKIADERGCLCDVATFEYIDTVSGPFLGEG